MRYRCRAVKKYAGISVCERWNVFENFLADMGLPKDGQSIDRINGVQGYSPENCRWADITTQNRNRKNVKLNPMAVERIKELAKAGVMQKAIAKEFGIDSSAVSLVVRGKLWKDTYVMG